ncbi:MAG: hypothetical protein AAFN92_16105 [Bacteroidota bacterium]
MRLLIFLFLFCSCATTRTQTPARTQDFFLDPVGKLYYLLADDRLVTDNPLGQNRFEFYDSSLGKPDLVDVTNPFALLLYYETYGLIVVLDRTLSEVSRLDLYAIDDILEPAALARAADNNIWVFDAWDYRLKLLDGRGEVARQTNDLRLELGVATTPEYVYVDRNAVLLHFREAGRLAVFTNYGRFQRWVDLPQAENFGWHAPFLYGDGDNAWRWQQGARPQVQGPLRGKGLAVKEGIYVLQTDGTARLVPFANK